MRKALLALAVVGVAACVPTGADIASLRSGQPTTAIVQKVPRTCDIIMRIGGRGPVTLVMGHLAKDDCDKLYTP